MSLKLIDYIIGTRHYQSGEPFKASDINTLLGSRKNPVKIDTIRGALGAMVRGDLLNVLPRNSPDESFVYIKAEPKPIFKDGVSMMSRPWRRGAVQVDCSPRYF